MKTKAKLTPTEDRILALLSDGAIHSLEELWGLLAAGDMAEKVSVQMHLSNLRKKIADQGLGVMACVGSCYRLVQFIPARNGKPLVAK
jgi:hypothetical protein